MLRKFLSGALLIALATALGRAQAPPPKAAPALPAAPVVKLAVAPVKALPGARYTLLPDNLDLTPGNAAPMWLRAGQSARVGKIADKEHAWAGTEVKLADLPRAQVRAFLERFKVALALADRAARRNRCDWGRDPLTIKTLQEDLGLDEIQSMRQVAVLLTIRCRLALAERDFDRALYTLQTGFALARHLGETDLMIQDLVAIAISAIMFSRVEEWMQMPGSPNLYWALTELPSPFVTVRPAVRSELGKTIYRSFPELREIKKKSLDARQVEALVGKMLDSLTDIGAADSVPPWMRRLGTAGLAMQQYPESKRYLLDQGMPAAKIEGMPALQVVVIANLDRYDRSCNDILKWLSVPPYQGWDQLDKVAKRIHAESKSGHLQMILSLLTPALTKTYAAEIRSERQIAGLHGAEALRLYAAANGGKVPAKWSDITEVPLPIDPVTGKGLDAFYRVQDGTAILDVPPPLKMPAPQIGRRYELVGKKG